MPARECRGCTYPSRRATSCAAARSSTAIATRARAIAGRLDGLGIGPGDRVAIVSPNCARFVAALFGVCDAGRILVPINFRLHSHEVAYIVEHSGAKALLVDPELDASLAS